MLLKLFLILGFYLLQGLLQSGLNVNAESISNPESTSNISKPNEDTTTEVPPRTTTYLTTKKNLMFVAPTRNPAATRNSSATPLHFLSTPVNFNLTVKFKDEEIAESIGNGESQSELPYTESENFTEISNPENKEKKDVPVANFDILDDEEVLSESIVTKFSREQSHNETDSSPAAENNLTPSRQGSVDASNSTNIQVINKELHSITISYSNTSKPPFIFEQPHIDDFVNEMGNDTYPEPVTISPTKVDEVTSEKSNAHHSQINSQPVKSLESLSEDELKNISSKPTASSDESTVTIKEDFIGVTSSIGPSGFTEDAKIINSHLGTSLYSSILERRDKSYSVNSTEQVDNSRQNSDDANTPHLSAEMDNKPLSTGLFTFDDFPKYTQVSHETTKSMISENSNFGLEPGVVIYPTSTVITNHQTLYQDSTEPADSHVLLSINDSSVLKINENQAYTVILPRNCSKDSLLSRILQLAKTANETYLTCNLTNIQNLTLNSIESFNKAMELIKTEVIANEMVLINIHSNSTLFFDLLSLTDKDGFYVSKLTIYIISATSLSLLIFTICVAIYIKVKCRRDPTSLNLTEYPHLSLKPDYHLAPIPRPSISYPESNRDFLHAYANETYNRARLDDTVLSQHHFTGNVSNAYELVVKDNAKNQEMHTFGRKATSRKQDSSSREYASADSWDHIKDREPSKKYGLDNPGYRKW